MDAPRILYISCGENGLYGLKRLLEHGIKPTGVVSLPPELGRKYGVSGYADFGPYCEQVKLTLKLLDNYNLEPHDVADISFNLIVVNGWNRLIAPDVIGQATLGGLGIHAGHPPVGVGRAPLVWNIIKDQRDIEVYVFRLTSRADDGDIVALRTVEITEQDNVALLYQKVMHAGAELFPLAIARVAAGEHGAAQDRNFIRHYPKRTPKDGAIDWGADEWTLYNFIRAQVPPYPGAFSYLEGERWTILDARPFDRFAFRERPREPGRILAVLPAGPVVMTGGAALWILKALVGAEAQPVEAWAGRETLLGRRFVPVF